MRRPIRSSSPKRSNTWIVFGSFGLIMVAAWAYKTFLQPASGGRFDSLMGALFGLPFAATALAQWRSGYLWANLREGNRGAHCSEAPGKFLWSTAGHFLVAAVITSWAVWRFFRSQ